jgi:hypothetical protein
MYTSAQFPAELTNATHITKNNNKRKEKPHYSEQQNPELLQPVHLKMTI